MRARFLSLLAIGVFMLCFDVEARTWTHKDGRTVEAEAVSLSRTGVTLELADGTRTTIPVNQLSIDDQAFLKTWKPKRPIEVPEKAVYHDGSWFHVILEEMTWKLAAQKAEKMGGRLAVINDAETQELIVSLADGLLLWIGATDEEIEGRWRWVDGEKLAFTAWGSTEPNGGRKENYARLGKRGKWIDVDDRGGAHGVVGFIVQWK